MRIALALILFASPVFAGQCGPHAAMALALERVHKETLTARALNEKGWLFEVYTSKEGKFTILLTPPASFSCIVSHGTNWEGHKRREPEEKS